MSVLDDLKRYFDYCKQNGTQPVAVSNAIFELKNREWHPIETAPKDGTFVDLWVNWSDGAKRVPDCKWDTDDDGRDYREGFWHLQDRQFWLIAPEIITHWMPVPPPPVKN
jgi:hypothetical protein